MQKESKNKDLKATHFLLIVLCLIAFLSVIVYFTSSSNKVGKATSLNYLNDKTTDFPTTDTFTTETTKLDCDPCTEIATSTGCLPSGKTVCKDKRCVSDPAQCYCNDECAPCIEKCNVNTNECEDARRTLCSDGTCVSDPSNCKCPKPCKYCVETCINGKCVDTDYIICDDGSCKGTESRCPSNCNPPCDSCTEYCAENKICTFSAKQRCPNGKCIWVWDVCTNK